MQKSSSEFQGGEAVIVVCNNTRVILRNLAELGLQLQELASFTTTYTTWNYIFLAGISSRNNLFFAQTEEMARKLISSDPVILLAKSITWRPVVKVQLIFMAVQQAITDCSFPLFQSPMMCFSSMLTYNTNWENQEIGNQQHHWSHGYEIRNPEATAESDSFMGVVKPAIKSALNHGLEEPAALKTY